MSVVVRGNDFVQLPSGTTAQRPGSPVLGMIRINTTSPLKLEVWDGYAWAVWALL